MVRRNGRAKPTHPRPRPSWRKWRVHACIRYGVRGLTSVARHVPTAPGVLAMLGRAARHSDLMSSSQSEVSTALGCHT